MLQFVYKVHNIKMQRNTTQLKANARGGVLQIVYVADRRAATTGHYKSIRLRWGVAAPNLRLNEGNLGSDRILGGR